MSKLHELLAVQDNVKKQANATTADLKNTFEKKRNHFVKRLVTFKSVTEGTPDAVEEQQDIQTTVPKELKWIGDYIVKAMDIGYQVDIGNTIAKADVFLDNGNVLLTGVPATALLQLEHRLQDILQLVHSIPTLDPSAGFQPDAETGEDIFKAREIKRSRTHKKFSPVIMAPATDKHPAQVKELFEDVPTGTQVVQEWSGLITVAQKGDMIDRVEQLVRQVKKARSKANEVEFDVNGTKIGAKVWEFVTKG